MSIPEITRPAAGSIGHSLDPIAVGTPRDYLPSSAPMSSPILSPGAPTSSDTINASYGGAAVSVSYSGLQVEKSSEKNAYPIELNGSQLSVHIKTEGKAEFDLLIRTNDAIEGKTGNTNGPVVTSTTYADSQEYGVTLRATVTDLGKYGVAGYYCSIYETKPKTRKPILVTKTETINLTQKDLSSLTFPFSKEISARIRPSSRQEFHFYLYKEQKTTFTSQSAPLALLIVTADELLQLTEIGFGQKTWNTVAKMTADGKPLPDGEENVEGPKLTIRASSFAPLDVSLAHRKSSEDIHVPVRIHARGNTTSPRGIEAAAMALAREEKKLGDRLVDWMRHGSAVYKHPYSASHKPGRAVHGHLRYAASATGGDLFFADQRFDLQSLLDIIPGKSTAVLQRADAKDAQCFTIITSDRTLDLQAESQVDRDAWVAGLRYVFKGADPAASVVIPQKSVIRIVAAPPSPALSGTPEGGSRSKEGIPTPMNGKVFEEWPAVLSFTRFPAGPVGVAAADAAQSWSFDLSTSNVLQLDWMDKGQPLVALIVGDRLIGYTEVFNSQLVLTSPSASRHFNRSLQFLPLAEFGVPSLTFALYQASSTDKNAPISEESLIGCASIPLSQLERIAAARSNVSLPLSHPNKASVDKRLKKKNSFITVKPTAPASALSPASKADNSESVAKAREEVEVKGAIGDSDEKFLDDQSRFFPSSADQKPLESIFWLSQRIFTEQPGRNTAVNASAANLIQMDWLSKSDPILVVSQWLYGAWQVIDHTEWIRDNEDPQWKRRLYVALEESRSGKVLQQFFQFSIYDVDEVPVKDDDLLGRVVVDSAQLKQAISGGSGLSFPLSHPTKAAVAKRLRKKKSTLTLKGADSSGEATFADSQYPVDFVPPAVITNASAPSTPAASTPTAGASSSSSAASSGVGPSPVNVGRNLPSSVFESISKFRAGQASIVPFRGQPLTFALFVTIRGLVHVGAFSTLVAAFERFDTDKDLLVDATESAGDSAGDGSRQYGKPLKFEYFAELSQEVKLLVYNVQGREPVKETDIIGEAYVKLNDLVAELVKKGKDSRQKREVEVPLKNEKNKSIEQKLKNKNSSITLTLQTGSWMDETK